MGTVLLDCQIFAGGYDLTGTTNKVGLTEASDELDATTFGSNGFRERLGGIMTTDVTHEGFMAVPSPDNGLFASLGVQAQVFTVVSSATANSVGYALQTSRVNYQPLGGQVGEIAPASGVVLGDSPDGTVRGQLLLPKTSLSGTTNGTGFLNGAAASKVFAAVHCFTAGTTATVNVQSSVDNTFASPTTRATQVVTAIGGSWVKATAAVTDTWWRVNVASVTGTFVLAVLVAIV